MKICVLIPIHNEAKQIGRLVRDIRGQGLDAVVVDDGSTDLSGALAQESGAAVLTHDQKCGKGASLQHGFRFIAEKGYDAVITMDGDGQHDPADLPVFLNKAQGRGACVINGSRMQDTQPMPRLRLVTNCLMSWLISLICRQKIPDTQCGFRYISTDILKRLRLSAMEFEIETEVLIQVARMGYPVDSVAIKTIYQDERSKINPLRDTGRFVCYLFKELTGLGRR